MRAAGAGLDDHARAPAGAAVLQGHMAERAAAVDDHEVGADRDAEQHLEIIQRFGRFPARNAALGRQSTDQELAFLNNQDR